MEKADSLSAIIKHQYEENLILYGPTEDSFRGSVENKVALLSSGQFGNQLSQNPLSRQIVRAILAVDSPVSFCGRDAKYQSSYDIIIDQSNDAVNGALYPLMNEHGLLDFLFWGCGSPNMFAFTSEIIVSSAPDINPVHLECMRKIYDSHPPKESTYPRYAFIKSDSVRLAVSDILKHFEQEPVTFVLPKVTNYTNNHNNYVPEPTITI